MTLLVFGASGDMASRLLLPALGQLLTREPDRRIRIIGVGSDEGDEAWWQERIHTSFATVDAEGALSAVVETRYERRDVTDAEALRDLFASVATPLAIYFALPPAVTAASCGAMTGIGVPEGTLLVLEKPFGTNEASAHALNQTLAALVPENQIFRVDHFLGNTMLLNLAGVRFANRILEPLWSAEHVESVAIIYDESLGLEGRARYYDKAGALVDMLQSHLLQVLAFVAMEPPATLEEVDLRDATGAVLRATRVWDDDPIRYSRHGRYAAGNIEGRALPAYVDEAGVDPTRNTETAAEATFEVRTSRWAGVPFTLRSGKALGDPVHEIVVRFKPVNHLPTGLKGDPKGAVLRYSLKEDTFSIELNVSSLDDPFVLERATLSTDLGAGALKAYTEVLAGILDADPTLSVRADAAERCWAIIQPILDAWGAGEVPLQEYPAGSVLPEGWTLLR